jgi:hypothetical protein
MADHAAKASPDDVESPMPRCVYVVGMHRSGTSATADVLGRLGLISPATDELIPATGTNERGHHESKSLVRFNERLLAAVGGTWAAPPTLAPGWEGDQALDERRAEGATTFATVFPRSPASWKDPRHCILLPFWQTVLGPGTAAVFVYRQPLEVARSLQWRDGLQLTHGLALWERYARAACANLEGIPTYCSDYGRLVDDPRAWCSEVAAFLGQTGVVIDAARIEAAPTAVERELQHQSSDGDDGRGLGDSSRLVAETLQGRQGAHHPWRSPDLGPEPAWVADVLAMRLEYDLLHRSHRAVMSSRALRVALAVGRLRRRPS